MAWAIGLNKRTDIYVAHCGALPADVKVAYDDGWRPYYWTRNPSEAATFTTAPAAELFARGLPARDALEPVYLSSVRVA